MRDLPDPESEAWDIVVNSRSDDEEPAGAAPGVIDRLFDDPTECRSFAAGVSMHWYPPYARVGTACYCGTTVMKRGA